MKNRQQIKAAIEHLMSAREGALRACRPPEAGVVMEYADEAGKRHAEQLRDENFQKVVILSRMIDSLRWSIGEPSELAEWIQKWDRMDEIERKGKAFRRESHEAVG